MKQFHLIAIVLAVVGPIGAASASDELTGAWKVRVSFGGAGGGGRVSILRLRMDGDKLVGVMIDQQGPATTLENVSYTDRKLSFELARVSNGQKSTTKYSGTFANGSIEGTMQSERRGSSRTLRWEATRTTSAEISETIGAPPVAADIELSDENYSVWRDHILPDPS
jgi:hypothetical protein